MKRLVIATTNPHKVQEIRTAFDGFPGWSIESLPPGLPGIEETGSSFLQNATQKAEHFSRHVDALTLADDSGLCVAALSGAPGIRSARYAADTESRIARLLRELQDVPVPQRKARFVCALALAQTGRTIWTVERGVAGQIAVAPSGTHGFGYDPIFFLPEAGRTIAEMTTREKEKVSHRGQALAELREFLKRLPE